tara:strand:+ start:301 stop:501 length:201 start_codon:yes stop_codon:yes gene_type:complete
MISKYFLIVGTIASIAFSSYYSIGDTITVEHQESLFDVCYGDYSSNQLSLSDFRGDIIIFGLSASW